MISATVEGLKSLRIVDQVAKLCGKTVEALQWEKGYIIMKLN